MELQRMLKVQLGRKGWDALRSRWMSEGYKQVTARRWLDGKAMGGLEVKDHKYVQDVHSIYMDVDSSWWTWISMTLLGLVS